MSIEYASATERKIATALVGRALAAGYSISVYDNEEWTLDRSTDCKAILAALTSTGEDVLRFYAGDQKIGWVQLIWGGGEDLISDYSANERTEALVEGLPA
jgi:hypothetical protein